jgi:hypothetical protein
MSAGTPPDPSEVPTSLKSLEQYSCLLVWEIDVKRSEFYTLQIGHRGESTYSHDDLKADKFTIQLSLGS